jgi:hypothetical protein
MTSAKQNREGATKQHSPAKNGRSRINRYSPWTAKKIGEANSLAKAILKTTSQPEEVARHWHLRVLKKRRFEPLIVQPLKLIFQQPQGTILSKPSKTSIRKPRPMLWCLLEAST